MAIMDGTRTVRAATAPAATPPSPTQLMHPAIAQHRSGISAICQGFGIRRLEVFGSAARVHDFDPERSDADFLVEFAPGV